MAKGPFKMKGSPMQRNFGIGSPMKQDKEKTTRTEEDKKEEIEDTSTKEIQDYLSSLKSPDGGIYEKTPSKNKPPIGRVTAKFTKKKKK
jgi:hypothetical protein